MPTLLKQISMGEYIEEIHTEDLAFELRHEWQERTSHENLVQVQEHSRQRNTRANANNLKWYQLWLDHGEGRLIRDDTCENLKWEVIGGF